MISMFSRPAVFMLSATNCAARRTSGTCSGRVLTLGMRRKVFSSSRRRGLFCSTKRSVAWDTHHYRATPDSIFDRILRAGGFLAAGHAIAAPAPPPATTTTIATLAPVDMPPLGAGGGVFAGAAAG